MAETIAKEPPFERIHKSYDQWGRAWMEGKTSKTIQISVKKNSNLITCIYTETDNPGFRAAMRDILGVGEATKKWVMDFNSDGELVHRSPSARPLPETAIAISLQFKSFRSTNPEFKAWVDGKLSHQISKTSIRN